MCAAADATVRNSSCAFEEPCDVKADSVCTDPVARSTNVSFLGFQTQGPGSSARIPHARDQLPALTPQYSQLLLRSVPRSSSRVQRHGVLDYVGSNRGDMLPRESFIDTNVGYMLPPVPAPSQSDGMIPVFSQGRNRSRLLSRHMSSTRLTADSDMRHQQDASGQCCLDSGLDQKSSTASLLAVATGVQVWPVEAMPNAFLALAGGDMVTLRSYRPQCKCTNRNPMSFLWLGSFARSVDDTPRPSPQAFLNIHCLTLCSSIPAWGMLLLRTRRESVFCALGVAYAAPPPSWRSRRVLICVCGVITEQRCAQW